MATIFGNTDADIVFPLAVSKTLGVTLNFNFLTNYVPTVVSGDTWNLTVKNAAGTAVLTLTSGSGLTLSGSNIQATMSVSALSAIATGGYSYALNDTTASRTRISGSLVINP